MKKFSIGVWLRIMIILICCMGISWSIVTHKYILTIFFFLILVWFTIILYRYVTGLNRKIQKLFDAIRYQDFTITYRIDNNYGQSFQDLNEGLNDVIRSFNNVRAEREATLQFLQVIIQQINVGIMTYDVDGKIEIINPSLRKMLHLNRTTNLKDIKLINESAYETIIKLHPGESKLISLAHNDLSFSMSELRVRGRVIRLVAIHNIRSELQVKELEAWQNLTKVLRHEILNSVTPIVSLVETMQDIVDHDLKSNDNFEVETITDLKDALDTVRRRGKGIMHFVNAYREFTSIPQPIMQHFEVETLLQSITNFYQQQGDQKATLRVDLKQSFSIFGDINLLEQVLINLIKNAQEVTYSVKNPTIEVYTMINDQEKSIIVRDNGVGIPITLHDKIFIPFFTSKKTGNGIGLSLSRQIMQMQGGSLDFVPNQPHGATFIVNVA